MKKHKLLLKLLSGTKNIRFSEVVAIAEAFGFQIDRINGSHHILVHPEIPELLNLQTSKERQNLTRSSNCYNWLKLTTFSWGKNDERLSHQYFL